VAARGWRAEIAYGLVRFLVRRTSWGAADPFPLVRRRRAGQLPWAAWSAFTDRPVTFLALGALAIPLTALAALVVSLARALPGIGSFIELADGGGGGSQMVLSTLTGGVAIAFSFTLVTAAVAAVHEHQRADGPQSLGVAASAVRARGAVLAGTSGIEAVVAIAVLATVVGAPLAVYLVVRWEFLPQVVVLGGAGPRHAFGAGARLVRRRWWHTALVVASVSAVVFGSGFVVSLLALVLFSSLPLWSLSVISATVSATVLPLGGLALTLLYGDAVAQSDGVAALDGSDRERYGAEGDRQGRAAPV
jgi:hypothetical protein